MAVRPARMISAKLFMHRTANPQLPRYQVHRVFAIPAAQSFYELLGLNEEASQEEIRTAFRRLAKEKHPDVSQDDNSEQEFMQLKQAYDTLTDAAARAHYDWNLQQQTASRRRGAPDGGRSSSVRPPGSGYGNSQSGSGFRTRQATPQDVHRRRHDGQRLSRSSSSRDARPQRFPYHHQQQAPTYHAPPPVGGSGRRRPEGWVGSWPLSSDQQSAAARGTLGPSGEDDWSGSSAAGNRSGGTAGATPRVGPSGTVGAWGDDWPPNPRVAYPTNHKAPPPTPSGGDDWGSWAAAAQAARSNVASSNGGGRSQVGQAAPAGPMSGDDWNTLYAHVVTLGGPHGTSSTASPTAASSASNEWSSAAGGALSSRDDLEGYSDVVLATSTSSPVTSPSAAVMDDAAAAAEGSRGVPSSAHIGGSSSSSGAAATSGAFDQGAAATRPAALSSGDDFELYSDVVDLLPAGSNGSGTDAANLNDLGEQQAATGLVAGPATAAAAVMAPQPKGDDFELLSMSAAMPGDSAVLESDERRSDSVAGTAPAVSPSPPPPPPPSGPPSGDDFALLAFLTSVKGDASAAASPSQSAEQFAHSRLKGVSFSGARSVWERSLPSEQTTKQQPAEPSTSPSPLPSEYDGDALETQPPLPDPAVLVGEIKPPSAALESGIEELRSAISEEMSSDSGLSKSTDLYDNASGRVPGDGTRGWVTKQPDDSARPPDVGAPAASWSNASDTLLTPALPPSAFTGRSMPYSLSVLAAALASTNVSSATGGLDANVTGGGDSDGHADMTLPAAAVGNDDEGNAGRVPLGLEDLENSKLTGGEPGATDSEQLASECRASDDEGRGAGLQETSQQPQEQDQLEHQQQEQQGAQEAPGPASGLSFSDAWDMNEGWRRSISPIKSAGIYFSDRAPATDGGGGGGGGGGSIFSKPQPEVTPRKGAGSIFGNTPSQPPP